MSKVGGEQIVGVLSSHNRELCHIDELKGLTIFFFNLFIIYGCIGSSFLCEGFL